MAKDANIAIRLDSEMKQALARAAEEDRRSLSSMVEKIIADWLLGRRPTSRKMREATKKRMEKQNG